MAPLTSSTKRPALKPILSAITSATPTAESIKRSLKEGLKKRRAMTWDQTRFSRLATTKEDLDAATKDAEEHGDFDIFDDYMAGKGKSWAKLWNKDEAVEIVKLHLERRVRASRKVQGGMVTFMDWSELAWMIQLIQAHYASLASDAWWARSKFDEKGFDLAVVKFGQDLRIKYGLGDDLRDYSLDESVSERRRRAKRREESRMKEFGGHFQKQLNYLTCDLCADFEQDRRDEIYDSHELYTHQAEYHIEAFWDWMRERNEEEGLSERMHCPACEEVYQAQDLLMLHLLLNHDSASIFHAIPVRHLPAVVATAEFFASLGPGIISPNLSENEVGAPRSDIGVSV